MGKGENAGNQHCLLFPQRFQPFPKNFIFRVKVHDFVVCNILSIWTSLKVFLLLKKGQIKPIDCWLIVWCFNAVFKGISAIARRPVHLSMLSWSSFNSTPHSILSKPMAAFPHNHCQNNGQRWERNESGRYDYHQSSERILAEPGIEPATPCSQAQ